MPTEWIKTAAFLGVALLVAAVVTALAAFDWLGGGGRYASFSQEVGTELFPDLSDPDQVGSLEIVEFDEKSATLSRFRVAQNDGTWTIASHDGYPAEAQDRVGRATAALMQLIVDDVASGVGEGDSSSGTHDLHQQYGVVEPDPKNVNVGETGVGLLVRLADTAGAALAGLVIGKQVPDSENLRYVRKPGEDAVYIVQIDPERFSTRFEDWINKDLLEVHSDDLRRMVVKDYEVVTVTDQAGFPRGQRVDDRAQLTLSSADHQWKLEELKTAGEDGKLAVAALGDDEQLNSTKVNDAARALADVEIAGVTRKPATLAQTLREKGDLSTEPDDDSLFSLQEHGFYVQPILGAVRVYSDAGDLVVGANDGVEYLIRFGTIDPTSQKSGADADKGETNSSDSGSQPEVSLNRFVFVTTRVNEKLIGPPELTPVPGEEPMPDQPTDANGGDDASGTNQPPPADRGGDSKLDDSRSEDSKPDEGGDDAKDASRDPFDKTGEAPNDSTCGLATETEAGDEASPPSQDEAADADASEGEEPASSASVNDNRKGNEDKDSDPTTQKQANPPAESNSDNDAPPADPDPATAEDRQRQLEARKKKILADNKAAQEKYDQQVQDARDKVAKLNDRFADWYFVVPEATYKKIRLAKDELIEKKQPADGLQPPPDQNGLPGLDLPKLGN